MITRPRKEIIGNRYGRLTVMLDCGQAKNGAYQYITMCDCGESKVVLGNSMVNGSTKSCGCIRRETTSAKNIKHQGCSDSAYQTWQGMKTRCLNPNTASYKNYGGRGITIDAKWMDYSGFLEDMGERPDGHTLERLDNSKGYSKDNCKWASTKEQARNTRQNVNLTHNGKTMCMMDWSKELNIPYPTIQDRVRRGWSVDKVLTRRK